MPSLRAIAVFCAFLLSVSVVSPTRAVSLLMVGADAGPTSGADQEVFDYLESRYGAGTVSYQQATAVETGDELTFDGVVVSSTLNSGDVRGKFHNSPVGVINWEQVVADNGDGDFQMTDSVDVHDFTDLNIADNTHPIAQGLATGPVTIYSVPSQGFSVDGTLPGGVVSVATISGGTEDGNPALLAADFGAALAGGGGAGDPDTAPGRRVQFPMTDDSFANLTADGRELFGRSVDYLIEGPKVLALYTFPTEDAAGLEPVHEVPGADASAIMAGDIRMAVTSPGTPTFDTAPVLQVRPPEGEFFTDLDAAVANDAYFQFSIEPTGASPLELTSIVFGAAKGGGNDRGFGIASSLDGFSTILDTASVPTTRPDLTGYQIDLTGLGFQQISNEVTFRVYAFQQNDFQSLEFDNLGVVGRFVTVVPEPATATLLLLGGAAAFGRRRRA